VASDLIPIVIGAVLILWGWWFPRKWLDIRDRVSASGGDVEKFDRAGRGIVITYAPKVVVCLGIVVVGVEVVGLLS
jgi:hypothetical protein